MGIIYEAYLKTNPRIDMIGSELVLTLMRTLRRTCIATPIHTRHRDQFIDSGTVGESTRKLIQSHVMRGKNAGRRVLRFPKASTSRPFIF